MPDIDNDPTEPDDLLEPEPDDDLEDQPDPYDPDSEEAQDNVDPK